MFSFLSSFGASSNFEKYRLILTTKNYQAPDQTSLKRIIETFRGQDEETRSQIAFATIIKKLHTSDSSQNWIYLLKNLLILDRQYISHFSVVEENCFLEQISTLNLKPIEGYQQQNQAAKALNSENILKSYWTLIQYKSSLLSQKSYQKGTSYLQVPSGQKRDNTFSKTSNSPLQSSKVRKSPENNFSNSQNQSNSDTERNILSVFRSQKQQFLKTLTVHQIYKQSLQLERLFELIFRVIASIEPNISKLKKKKSLISGQDEQLTSRMQNSGKSAKEIPSRSTYRSKEQENTLLQNLLPISSMPDILKPNNEYNQKYKSSREQFFNSKLINYLHLQLLYKLLSAYSNQLICIRTFVAHLIQQMNPNTSSVLVESIKNVKLLQFQNITEKDVILWKKIISNYLMCSEKIITYVHAHKTVKGFELINYQQLSPFLNANINSILDDFIEHRKTLQEPEIVKVEDLGVIMNVNNHIKVQKKAHCSHLKALTARKMVFPSRNLKDKNNAFYNWHNGYSTHFPPKEVLTIDLLMQIRQNPHNPATQVSSQDDDDQSIYQPFLVNRHSCIYNFRQSNISAVSEFQFIPLQEMKKKEQEKLQSVGGKKGKNFYYFRADEKDKEFKNIYSSLSKQQSSIWVR